MKKKYPRILYPGIGLIGLCLFFALCAGCAKSIDSPRPDRRSAPPGKETGKSPATQRPYTVMGKRYTPIASAHGFVQTGIASWYGKKFHGRKTSNGEIYDMYAMTAAHKTLPMNTWVEVHNLDTNKKSRCASMTGGRLSPAGSSTCPIPGRERSTWWGQAQPGSGSEPWVRPRNTIRKGRWRSGTWTTGTETSRFRWAHFRKRPMPTGSGKIVQILCQRPYRGA